MKEASVIIVSFNSLLGSTKPCLESLFQNTAGLDYEVIVVDNGSQDGTQEFLKLRAGADPRLRYIANPSNLGYAAANNIGLAAAQGECLVLLNSDTLVTDQSLAKLTRFLRANPDVGLAGPSQISLVTSKGFSSKAAALPTRWHKARSGPPTARATFSGPNG